MATVSGYRRAQPPQQHKPTLRRQPTDSSNSGGVGDPAAAAAAAAGASALMHAYRLPAGVTTVKFGDPAAGAGGAKQLLLPALHGAVAAPGVLGPLVGVRRHHTHRSDHARAAAGAEEDSDGDGDGDAGQSPSQSHHHVRVVASAADVDALIAEVVRAGTSSALDRRDIEILTANGVLPPLAAASAATTTGVTTTTAAGRWSASASAAAAAASGTRPFTHPQSFPPRAAGGERRGGANADADNINDINGLDEDNDSGTDSDSSEPPYPYPRPPATAGPFRMPTMSHSIKHQNIRLGALLALLNRAYGGDAGGGGGRDAGGRSGRGNARAVYIFNGEDSRANFDKNLSEIQRLMERAKNFDDKGYLVSVVSESDKAGKKKKSEKQATSLVPASHHQQQQQQQQQPMFDLFADNKTLAGRKPIRVIAADLVKRIERLKSNQAEWDAFQAKILEYREVDQIRARTAPADMIRLNRQSAGQTIPADFKRMRMASVKEARDRHRHEIRSRKAEQDMERWNEKVAALQKKKDVMEQMKKKEKEQMGRAQALQRKWFVLTAVASRMTLIRIVLETERQRRAMNLTRLHAARVIQSVYRNHLRRREEARRMQALAKISVVFRRYVARRRENQKHMASDAIRQFFRDVYDVSRLMKVVKKYRFSVVKAQGYVLHWHEMRNAQLRVLSKYWDKLEPLWWNQRKSGAAGVKKSGSNADLDEKKDKLKSKKARGKSKKDDAVEKVPLKMTPVIKRNILLADLIIRRKEYRGRIATWEQDVLAYNASHRTGKGEPGPPKRPVFKLLPPQPEMLTLIEKGFLEAASAGWK
ncbi:hypothetical protein HDU86_003169 [Geranomyces michiganensis]|nr:hypothetical protein HDU86_003169 [Geranomyces michiganensis]